MPGKMSMSVEEAKGYIAPLVKEQPRRISTSAWRKLKNTQKGNQIVKAVNLLLGADVSSDPITKDNFEKRIGSVYDGKGNYTTKELGTQLAGIALGELEPVAPPLPPKKGSSGPATTIMDEELANETDYEDEPPSLQEVKGALTRVRKVIRKANGGADSVTDEELGSFHKDIARLGDHFESVGVTTNELEFIVEWAVERGNRPIAELDEVEAMCQSLRDNKGTYLNNLRNTLKDESRKVDQQIAAGNSQSQGRGVSSEQGKPARPKLRARRSTSAKEKEVKQAEGADSRSKVEGLVDLRTKASETNNDGSYVIEGGVSNSIREIMDAERFCIEFLKFVSNGGVPSADLYKTFALQIKAIEVDFKYSLFDQETFETFKKFADMGLEGLKAFQSHIKDHQGGELSVDNILAQYEDGSPAGQAIDDNIQLQVALGKFDGKEISISPDGIKKIYAIQVARMKAANVSDSNVPEYSGEDIRALYETLSALELSDPSSLKTIHTRLNKLLEGDNVNKESELSNIQSELAKLDGDDFDDDRKIGEERPKRVVKAPSKRVFSSPKMAKEQRAKARQKPVNERLSNDYAALVKELKETQLLTESGKFNFKVTRSLGSLLEVLALVQKAKGIEPYTVLEALSERLNEMASSILEYKKADKADKAGKKEIMRELVIDARWLKVTLEKLSGSFEEDRAKKELDTIAEVDEEMVEESEAVVKSVISSMLDNFINWLTNWPMLMSLINRAREAISGLFAKSEGVELASDKEVFKPDNGPGNSENAIYENASVLKQHGSASDVAARAQVESREVGKAAAVEASSNAAVKLYAMHTAGKGLSKEERDASKVMTEKGKVHFKVFDFDRTITRESKDENGRRLTNGHFTDNVSKMVGSVISVLLTDDKAEMEENRGMLSDSFDTTRAQLLEIFPKDVCAHKGGQDNPGQRVNEYFLNMSDAEKTQFFAKVQELYSKMGDDQSFDKQALEAIMVGYDIDIPKDNSMKSRMEMMSRVGFNLKGIMTGGGFSPAKSVEEYRQAFLGTEKERQELVQELQACADAGIPFVVASRGFAPQGMEALLLSECESQLGEAEAARIKEILICDADVVHYTITDKEGKIPHITAAMPKIEARLEQLGKSPAPGEQLVGSFCDDSKGNITGLELTGVDIQKFERGQFTTDLATSFDSVGQSVSATSAVRSNFGAEQASSAANVDGPDEPGAGLTTRR